jgi:FkbM family methyltransferase
MLTLFNRLRGSASVRLKNYLATLRAWWHLHVDQRPFLYTDRNGITLKVCIEDDLRGLFVYRTHFDDPKLLAIVSSLLRPGATVFDVGANYGQFALFVAPRLGHTGRVYAFEPAPAVWDRLQENLACNIAEHDCITSYRLALSDQPGQSYFYHYPENPAWNSLHPHGKWRTLEDRARNALTILPQVVYQVDVTTLDSFCAKAEITNIDLLKIDVEGYELAVLHGARKLLEQRRVGIVVFEICPDLTVAIGHDPRIVIEFFTKFGYQCYKVESDERLTPVGMDFEFPYLSNYLAMPRA